jgi:hypothetical protein
VGGLLGVSDVQFNVVRSEQGKKVFGLINYFFKMK